MDNLIEEENDINEIEKMMRRDQQRQGINARYYQKHREAILWKNALKVKCKLCNVVINKGSHQLHRKSRLHKRL